MIPGRGRFNPSCWVSLFSPLAANVGPIAFGGCELSTPAIGTVPSIKTSSSSWLFHTGISPSPKWIRTGRVNALTQIIALLVHRRGHLLVHLGLVLLHVYRRLHVLHRALLGCLRLGDLTRLFLER